LLPKIPRVKVRFSINEKKAQNAAMIWSSTTEMATFIRNQEPRWLETWAAAQSQAAEQALLHAPLLH
jgi:hypothetical protein